MGPAACAIAAIALIAAVPAASAHSLFNSAEQTIGDYRMQVATLPEFPQIGEPSEVLFRLTDRDLEEVRRLTMGVRIFYDDQQIGAIPVQSVDGGHRSVQYVFERPGNHIFMVDVYDKGERGLLTYTFNMGTQSPFGYIFIVSITIGAAMFGIVVAYIYWPERFRRARR